MTPLIFKKVRAAADAEPGAVELALFRDRRGQVCGWFLGPVRLADGGVAVPYLPRSSGTMASLAVIRAIEAAEHANAPLCVIDPDDLWEPAWGGRTA